MQKPLSILTPIEPWQEFAEAYYAVRQKEYRLPDDELLARLPDVPSDHPHVKAWRMRKQGLDELKKALKSNLKAGSQILDIGCGNGWMSNRIAEAGFQVTAIDVNLPELEQAHRVFSRPGLHFAFADLFNWNPEETFEAALLASSIQYFEKPKDLIAHLFGVNPNMKMIFISDSPFYAQSKKQLAAERSKKYYQRQGYAEMAKNYHHHALQDIGFPCEVVYQPKRAWIRKLIGGSPFPIIKVTRTL